VRPTRPASSPSASRQQPAGARGALRACLVLLAVLAVACSGTADPDAVPTALPAADSSTLATPPPLQGDDAVDLTVYFRSGQGTAAQLVPVVREVAVSDDLPRRALELLLAGPSTDDGALDPVLPSDTRLLDLAVDRGTAAVVLSVHAVSDADEVVPSPTNEALALAAVANTLTEFTSIDRVDLDIEGMDDARAFWGGWGLPHLLVRDESLVGGAPGEAEGVVDLTRFSAETQEVGSASAPPAKVTGVRVRDRITHTRFVVELGDLEGEAGTAKVPLVRARRANDGIALLLSGVAAFDGDDGEGLRLDVDPDLFTGVRHEVDLLGGTLRLVLTPTEPRTWWLHTLANPTRVVLDVRK
jgi:hypothetical protein